MSKREGENNFLGKYFSGCKIWMYEGLKQQQYVRPDNFAYPISPFLQTPFPASQMKQAYLQIY